VALRELNSFGNATNQVMKLTVWGRDLLEKLTVTQLVMKFIVSYRARRFIIVFTRARHMSLF